MINKLNKGKIKRLKGGKICKIHDWMCGNVKGKASVSLN